MKTKKKIHRPSLIFSLAAFILLLGVFVIAYQNMMIGILSGIVVMILGIIGLTLSVKAKGEYRSTVAFVFSLISIILGVLSILLIIVVLLILQLGDPLPDHPERPGPEVSVADEARY